jgi:alpha-tubulin suppressor-like RCC1 family protein
MNKKQIRPIYFFCRIVTITIFIFILSSCKNDISVSLKEKSNLIVSGQINTLVGTLSKNEKSFFDKIFDQAIASGCHYSDISVKLYKLDNGVRETSPLAKGKLSSIDGRYTVTGTKALSEKVKNATSVDYVIDVSGCSADESYSRVVTGTNNQDVTSTSSFTSLILDLDETTRTHFIQNDKKLVEAFIKNANQGLSSTSTISDVFQHVSASAGLTAEFDSLTGTSLISLLNAAPSVKSLNMPSGATQEKKSNIYSITAKHWNPLYPIAYEWMVDGVVVSTDKSFTYVPTENTQGSHAVRLRAGKNNGSGAIDLTKPVVDLSRSLLVENTFPPIPPTFTVSGQVATQLTARPIDLAIETGRELDNCKTFSSLALKENDTTIPAAGDFTISCNDVETQLQPYMLASAGNGHKVLYLWAKDASGEISAVPSTLTTILVGTPDDANSSVTASPFNNVTNDGSTYSFVTVTIRDSLANPIAGRMVSITTSRGATDKVLTLNALTNLYGQAIFKIASTTVGTTTVTATDVNAALTLTQTKNIAFNTGGPSGLWSSLTKDIASVRADGTSFVTLTARVKDQANVAMPGRTVTIVSSRGATDSLSPATATTDANGEAFFTVRSTVIGPAVFSAKDTADGIILNQTQTVTFISGSPSPLRSTLTLSKSIIEPGMTSILTLILNDQFGNRISDATKANNLTVNLAGNGTSQGKFSAFSPVKGNPGAYTAIFTADMGGSPNNIKAYINGLGALSSSPAITVEPRFYKLTGPSSVIVGNCTSVITIIHQDIDGNPIAAGVDKKVTFSGSGNGLFFTDSNCTTSTSSILIPIGTYSKTFYFKDLMKESLGISANSAGVSSGKMNLDVVGVPVSGLVLTGPTPVTINTCTSAYTVTSVDQFGNISPVTSSSNVTLTSGAEGNLYSDANCSTPINSLTIPAGQSNRSFYFKGLKASSFMMMANAIGLKPASLPVTVTASSPVRLMFTGNSTAVTGTCNPLTISSADAFNNFSRVSAATTVSFSGKGSATFWTNNLCTTSLTTATIAAGTHSTTFYVKDSIAESLTLGATTPSLSSTTFALTTISTPATKLAVLGPTTISINQCGVYTVSTKDVNNNLTNASSNVTVNLSGNLTGFFYSDSNCTSIVTSQIITSGTNTSSFYFKAGTASSFTFNAADASAALTVSTLGVATKNTKLLLSGNQSINANTCEAYTLTNADASNNPVNTGAIQVVNLTGKGSGNFYSDSGCVTTTSSVSIANGASAITFYFKDATAEALTLIGTNAPVNIATSSLDVSVGAMKLAITGTVAPAIGSCSAYTVKTTNGPGVATNVPSNVVISLLGNGAGAFYSDAACSAPITTTTISAGTNSSNIYFKTNITEATNFVAIATGFTQGALAVTSVSTVASNLHLSGPVQASIGVCSSAFTVNPKDSNQNIVTLGSSVIANLTSSSSVQFFSDTNCTTPISSLTISAGQNLASFYIKSATAKQTILQATDDNSVLSNNSFPVTISKGFSHITAGNTHTCAINNGRALCWGRNNFGQLGNNTLIDSATPIQVLGLGSGVTSIAAGAEHTCAVVNGAAKCWGKNTSGQLGNGTIVKSSIPVQVKGFTSGVTKITAGTALSCAVKNGSLSCWGFGSLGALGNNSATLFNEPSQVVGLSSGVTDVVAADSRGCAITNGDAKCWGYNVNGTTGDNTQVTKSLPVQVTGLINPNVVLLAAGSSTSTNHNCAIVIVAGQNALQCWGANNSGQLGNGLTGTLKVPNQVTGLISGVTDVAIGVSQTCAVVNGGVQCWGANTTGNLGNGTTTLRLLPTPVIGLDSGASKVAVGASHSCAIVNGQIQCWGSNQYGQLGSGMNMLSTTPVEIISSGVDEVKIGQNHICARSSDRVLCSGENSSGQLGNNSITASLALVEPVGLGAGSQTTSISSGSSFSCAVINGAAKCWGLGTSGQLGNGKFSTIISPTPTTISSGVTSISSGSLHSCAIVNGTAKCWGDNDYGQIGDNSLLLRLSPTSVSGLSSGVTDISTGRFHTCAVVNGSAQCWGANIYGQLGESSFENRQTPNPVTGLSTGITKIASGANHSCAIKSGSLYCWGENSTGQLGNNKTSVSNIPVQVVGLTSGVTSVAAGADFSCAVKNATAFCWGSNRNGQLGSAATYQSLVPLEVEGLNSNVKSVQVSLDGASACAVRTDGALYCWGDNSSGQLGAHDNGISYTTLPVAVAPPSTEEDTLAVNDSVNATPILKIIGPTSISGGACVGPYYINLRDNLDVLATVEADFDIKLIAPASGSYYSDGSCETKVEVVTFNSVYNYVGFYYKNLVAEDVNLTASSEKFRDGSLKIQVVSTPTKKWKWTAPSTLNAGTCSSAITLNSVSLSDVPTNVTSNTVVDISGVMGGSFYTDSSCTIANRISSITVPSGTSSKTVYFKDTILDSLTIKASSDSYIDSAFNLKIKTGLGSKLQIQGPSTTAVGSCSRAYNVGLLDDANNLTAATGNITVNLSIGGTAKIYQDSSCTIPATSVTIVSGSTMSSRFFIQDRVAESLLFLASNGSLSSAIFPVKTIPNLPTQIAFTGSNSLEAGTCGTYQVSSRDIYNYPAPTTISTTVTLSGKGGATGSFYSNNACSAGATSAVIAASLNSQNFYYKNTAVESMTFIGSAPAISVGTYAVSTHSAPAVKLALTSAPINVTNFCIPVSVSTRDTNNNLVNATSNVTVNLGGTAPAAFYSDSGCTSSTATTLISSGTNSSTYYFKAASVASYTLTAIDASTTLTAATGLVVALKATKLIIAGSQTINQNACTAYTVTNANASDTPVNLTGAQTITFNGKGLGSFYSDAGCTVGVPSIVMALGANTITTYFKDPSAEALTFSFTNTAGVIATGTLNVNVGAMKLELTGPASSPAGVCSAYTMNTLNGAGVSTNVSANTTVTLQGNGAGAFYSDASCTTLITSKVISSGSNTSPLYFKTLLPESLTLYISATGFNSASLNVTSSVVAGAKLQITGPTHLASNTCSSPFTVNTLDTYENAIPMENNTTVNLVGAGATGAFYSDNNCTLPITSLSILAGNTGSFYLKNSTVDSKLTITASDQTSVLGNASSNVTIISATSHIAIGSAHICVIKNGALYCMGGNAHGELGTFVTSFATKPLLVPKMESGVIGVTANQYHTCAITSVGAVKCGGYNGNGQLGNGGNAWGNYAFVDVVGINSGAIKLTSTPFNTCALMSNGTMKCWGANQSGQLGDGSLTPSNIPVDVSNLTGITDISSNATTTCAVANGAVKCWGLNDKGQLGDGTIYNSGTPVTPLGFESGVTQIDTSGAHTCAVKNSGLYCWGLGTAGQLGQGASVSSLVPLLIFAEGSGVTSVTTSMNGNTCAIVNGALYCWGGANLNGNGENTVNRNTPQLIYSSGVSLVKMGSGAQACAVVNSQLRCWGVNNNGQLGTGANLFTLTPVDVVGYPAGSNVTSVVAGNRYNCAIKSGALQCWGTNGTGQLGNGTLTQSLVPVPVTGLNSGVEGGSAYDHSCFIVNGGAQCWGLNAFGQIGNETLNNALLPVTPVGLVSGVTGLSTNMFHTCAAVNGGAKCWGQGSNGQIGDGQKVIRTVPTQVSHLPAGSGVIGVATTLYSSCALLSDGSVQCWGYNGHGQLGNGTNLNSIEPVNVIELSRPAIAITGGNYHVCALLDIGAVQCWGSAGYGSLGNNTVSNSNVPVDVVGLSSNVTSLTTNVNANCATQNGGVKCWGGDAGGLFGAFSFTSTIVPVTMPGFEPGSGATSVSIGANNGCAVVNGGVKCWGLNTTGSSGDGTLYPNPATQITPTLVAPF